MYDSVLSPALYTSKEHFTWFCCSLQLRYRALTKDVSYLNVVHLWNHFSVRITFSPYSLRLYTPPGIARYKSEADERQKLSTRFQNFFYLVPQLFVNPVLIII